MKKLLYKPYFALLIIMSLYACNYTPLVELPYIDLKAGFYVSSPVAREGEAVKFTQIASSVTKYYDWDFGNGKTSTEPNPTNVYTKYGRYKVKLTVRKEDKVLVSIFEQEVIVLPLTEWLPQAKTYGSLDVDEQGFCFTPILNVGSPTPIGYMLVGRRAVNILRLVRLDANFNEVWTNALDVNNLTQGLIRPRSIIQTQDTSFVVVGSATYNAQDEDAFMLKISNELAYPLVKEKWRKIRNTSQTDSYSSLVEYTGKILVGGSTIVKDAQGNATTKLLVETYESSGKLEKSDIYGSNWQINAADFGTQGFAFALTEGTGGTSKPSLIFYSTSFVEKRKRTLNFLEGKTTDVSTVTNNAGADAGQIMVGNYTEPFTDAQGVKKTAKHAFIARLNDFGFLQWGTPAETDDKKVRKLEFYEEEYTKVLQMKEAGKDVFIAIGTHTNPLTGKDIVVCKYDEQGNLLKYKLIGRSGDDEAFDAKLVPVAPAQTPTEFVLFGTTQNTTDLKRRDFYLLKLNSNLE